MCGVNVTSNLDTWINERKRRNVQSMQKTMIIYDDDAQDVK